MADVPPKVGLRRLRQEGPAHYDSISTQSQPTNKNHRKTPKQAYSTKLEWALHACQMVKISLTLRGIFCLWKYKLVQPLEIISNVYQPGYMHITSAALLTGTEPIETEDYHLSIGMF